MVQKRKRRTQAEMKEVREREKSEKEALEQQREEKLRDLAALESKISTNDKIARLGNAPMIRPKPRPLKKKVCGC
jgi:hypothetical protein